MVRNHMYSFIAKTFASLLLFVSFAVVPGALAGDPADPHAAAYEAMVKLATPGKHHEILSQSVGTWKTHMKSYMDPSAPPVEYDGKVVVESVLDGRFVRQTYHAMMMGNKFTGIGLAGYDNAKNEYVSTWIDNFGTSITQGKGTYDATKKTLTTKGMMFDPSMGKDVPYKSVQTFIGKNTMSLNMYMVVDGKQVLLFEMTYTRLKDQS